MNSAIEVKDTPTEDLPLDEDYLGVNFNIEASDEVENGTPSVYLESLAPVDLIEVTKNEEEESVVYSQTEYIGVESVDPPTTEPLLPPSVVNGIDKSPVASPEPVTKKRLNQRRASIKSTEPTIVPQSPPKTPTKSQVQLSQQPPDLVIKLHKLSPGTIAKHTAPDLNENGEAGNASPVPKKRGNMNGPGLLRQSKHLKKKVARPKGGPSKKWDSLKVKDEKTDSDKCGALVPFSSGEPTEEHVECIRCSAVVAICAAREHLSTCTPVTPVKENDATTGLPSTSQSPTTPVGRSGGAPSTGRGYSTRASSIRSVQSSYGPDACGLCGARGLSDGLSRYLHTHLHHQRFTCIVCGSMHSKVMALVKHLQAVHGKEDRFYQGPDVGAQLSQVLGRASILVCTDCGAAIHVLDVEAHSLNCKATPRFPLPSQVGYHSDNQPLAVTYPISSGGSSAATAAVVASSLVESSMVIKQKRKYRTKIKREPPLSELTTPPDGYQLLEAKADPDLPPKKENLAAIIDAVAKAVEDDDSIQSAVEDEPFADLSADELRSDPNECSSDQVNSSSDTPKSNKKKAKVMLPSLGSPRGLRTLLPGNRGPPPSPPKRTRGPGLGRVLPAMGGVAGPDTESKNLLCGTEEEVDKEPADLDDSTGGPADRLEEPMVATREASPVPQLPPREKKDWKSPLEPLLYKLLLRVKKALRRIQLLHCPVCLRYETHESNLEEICVHLKVAHSNHLLRGLGEDTQNRLFSEVNSIFMEDVSNEEAEEYVDVNSCRKVLLKFCVEPLDKTYSCDLCNVNELSVKEMVQHLRGAHGFRMYPCLECGQQFKTYGYFISHLVSTGKESIYGCRLCGIVGMVSLYMLQSHLRTHSLCDICHTCFESQTALRKHMFNHQQDSPYACTVCQVSYKNYESLEMHLLWKHGTESKPCSTCQEKTWLCTYHFCPGAPASLSEVVDNPCVCTVCRLEFSKASMLKVHTRLHTGERPHKCPSCKKSFISKKLLGKHTTMKHSEAAINQAAVAQAAANEIKSALEKSGLRPKKLQQELLKLIGQQNAAKRTTSAAPSAAPSRRVSTEENTEQTSGPTKPNLSDEPVSADLPRTPDLVESHPTSETSDGHKVVDGQEVKQIGSSEPATAVPLLTANRVGCSIFDIEEDEEQPAPTNGNDDGKECESDHSHTNGNENGTISGEPVKEERADLKLPETNHSESDPVDKNADAMDSISEMETETKPEAVAEEIGSGAETSASENLLDLLASAATSKQAEIPAPLAEPPTLLAEPPTPLAEPPTPLAEPPTPLAEPPTPPPMPPVEIGPVIPPALLDHDYCTFGEPPADKMKPKPLRKKTHRHSKKHRAKKEPRFVLDLSSSSSDEGEGDNINGQVSKVNRPIKFGKVARLSDSDSSYCDSNCSCSGSDSDSSSSSSSSSSSNSNSSSSSSSSSSGSSSTDSSSSDSEDETNASNVAKAVPTTTSVTATPAAAATEKGADDEVDVDVENNSNEPSSPESSSDTENEEVESDADISVHESDLETSDSDSENKKRMRTSPSRPSSKKRKKKKKKKRRAFKDSMFINDHQIGLPAVPEGIIRVAGSTNSVDDIINAVASGLLKGAKSSKSPKVRRVSHATIDHGFDHSGGTGVASVAAASGAAGGSKRGRGKRKRNDDSYLYDGDHVDVVSNTSKKKKLKRSSMPAVRTTAKLKFTHNYDAFQQTTSPPSTKTMARTTTLAPSSSPYGAKSFSAPPNPFEDPERLYCYCRCPYDEVSQMIGCDANDCPYEWFHFECVGISEAPEGQWYCPECRLRPKYRAQFDEPFFQPPPPPQQII